MSGIYDIYTDGACSNNQGIGHNPGGWAAVFTSGEKFSGGEEETTNNRMELTGVIEGLKNTKVGSKVNIYSDSAYVVNMFNLKWIENWERNGYMTSGKKKPVENQDLVKLLRELEREREVTFIKVKGHSGNEWNELADKLATSAVPTNIKEKAASVMERENKVTLVIAKEKMEYLLKNINTEDEILQSIVQEIKQKII